MAIDKTALGSAVKAVRIARGLTQSQLARAAGLSSVALIEQGKRSVSIESLNALASALDVPPACLAILGSTSIGNNKAATEFMKSLQDLISTLVLTQRDLGKKTKRQQPKHELEIKSDQRGSVAKALDKNRRRKTAETHKPRKTAIAS